MHVVVAGATGFIGSALVRQLVRAGHGVTVLTRRPEEQARQTLPDEVTVVRWNPTGEAAPLPAHTDAVVNLAGATIARRWTAAAKKLILASRVLATRAIVDAMRAISLREGRSMVLINASAVGYYGPRGDERVPETEGPGDDFLARVCRQWEEAAVQAKSAGIRVVLLRIGLVLGQDGALPRLTLPFRVFAGGPLGSGRQWMPWVHIDDCVGLIRFALRNDSLTGPVNVSAPGPVQNREFARILGRVMGRPSFIPAPAFMLHVVLGEMATMILTGQRAVPEVARAAGYDFRYTDLETALQHIIGHSSHP